MSRLSERPVTAEVGEARPHESASLHVTGRALYTDDIALRTPYLLHAHPVCAPHAHAMITRLDPKPAYDVPGVVRVLTAEDVPGVNDAGTKHDEPLFPTEVMFHGHAVAWVLGESLEAARIGAAAVEVDYEPLPSIITRGRGDRGRRASRGRGRGSSGATSRPDWRGSTQVFEGEIDFAGQEHFYLETHASLATVDDDGQVFIQSSTQHPTETQEIVAHVLGLASHQVTVQCVRMGGGFGGKEMQPHGFAAVAALGARLTGRPVRVRLTRQQDMTMSGKRHGFHASWKVGFDDDGRLQALEATLTSDGGLEPRPVGAGAVAGAVPHRQRLLDPAHPGRRPGRADPQDLADRVPRLRRAAGDARDRGHPRPLRPAARDRPGRAAAAQLLRGGAGDAVRPTGAARRAARPRLAAGLSTAATSRSGATRSRAPTPRTPIPSGVWRSRR